MHPLDMQPPANATQIQNQTQPQHQQTTTQSLSHEECRRTLRRLELEAYASLVSVLRAQGALGPERKTLLTSVRTALHIGADRHSAEARRASNDELLSAIADQVSGPNTSLGWIKEGRRKIPILPRGIPQTVYTAIADKAAAKAIEENELIAQRKLEQHALDQVSPQIPADISEEEMHGIESSDDKCNTKPKKGEYPPVVMCDQSLKMLNDDGPPRKRSRSDIAIHPHRMTHQKHHNLSQIYNSYSKHPGKLSNQYGRNSYNQGGKMGMKSNHANLSKSAISKHRSMQKSKHCGQVAIPHHQVRSGIKSPTDPHIVGSQALCMQTQADAGNMKSQTPAYQANYAQQSIQNMDDSAKIPLASSESSNMQISTPTPISRDSSGSMAASSEESADNLTGVLSSGKNQQNSSRPCHIIIKNKNENPTDKKIQITNKQMLSKQDLGSIKVLQNRPLVVSTSNSNSQKLLNSSGKLITTKIVQHIPPKSQSHLSSIMSQSHVSTTQVLIMPKSPITTMQSNVLQRTLTSTPIKNIFVTSHANKEGDNTPAKSEGDVSSKNIIINSDLKIGTKTFLLNSKSGQKMVVLPAKPRTKSLTGQSVPLLQVKSVQGKPTAMKLLPVGSPTVNQSKPNNITVLSKAVNPTSLGTPGKVISKDIINPLKISSSSDSPVTKAPTQIKIAPKPSQTMALKQIPSKGNVIVVQKGVQKPSMVMKPVAANKVILDTQQSEVFFPVPHEESDKTGNLFFMECDNPPTQSSEVSETLNESSLQKDMGLLADDNQVSDEGNTDSIGSVSESLLEASNVDSTLKSDDSYTEAHELEKPIISSSFTDWEAQLANEVDKQSINTNKISDLNLELEISSDSDMGSQKAGKESEDLSQDEPEDINELYVQHSSITRTLLSQLQDEGSSSNDSAFVLSKNLDGGRLELLESSQTSSSAME